MGNKNDKKYKNKAAEIMAKVNEIMQSRREKSSAGAAAKKQSVKRAPVAKKPVEDKNAITQNRLELLITVVNRNKGEYFSDLLQSFDVNMQFIALGRGTADAKLLSRFGLTDSDKAVIFSVIQENRLTEALNALDDKFHSIKNGKGIAYTVPITSVIGTLIFGFLSNNKMTVRNDKT